MGIYIRLEANMYQNTTDTPRNFISTQDGDTQNKIGKLSPLKIPAIKIKGRRRPCLERKLSDTHPTTGSTTASKTRINVSAKPTSHGVTPKYMLKTAKATAGYNQRPHISTAVPRP